MAKKKKKWWELLANSKNSKILDTAPTPAKRKSSAYQTPSSDYQKRKSSAKETAKKQTASSKNSRVQDVAPYRKRESSAYNTSKPVSEYRKTTPTKSTSARTTSQRQTNTSKNSRVQDVAPYRQRETSTYTTPRSDYNKRDKVSNSTSALSRSKNSRVQDIAPVKQTTKKDDGRTWLQKSEAFKDGYQFGDVTKTILGSATDVVENLTSGVMGMGEAIVDASAWLAPGAYIANQTRMDMSAPDFKLYNKMESEMDKFIKKDLYNEQAIARKIISDPIKKTGFDPLSQSVFGEKSDSLIQSAGQLGATVGLQAVGVPWFVTTGVTSFGSETENALKQGATHGEAGGSALISAGAEILSEKLSGGISFGGKTMDDVLVKNLTTRISDKTIRSLTKAGIDAVGEGSEEVVSSVFSRLGSALYKEESIDELLTSEEAMDEYIESFIGGAVLGGASSVVNATKSNAQGKDFATGLSDNELKVAQVEINNRIAEKEADGSKVTTKEKNAITQQVYKDLEKGYIDIDTIESTLGGETYKKYKDSVDNETKLQQEYDELNKMKLGEMTGEQVDRKTELKTKLDEIKENSSKSEMRFQLDNEISNMIANDKLLQESYNERSRRGQAFEADLNKYDAKQQEIIKRATESGILNNTNRTHEFVDMVAKISADKGVLFDFTNNEKLKESGFAMDGKTINGYVKDGNIAVNINSNKALNTIVGHEITHVLEGTELYTELQNAVKEYATTKGEYQARYDAFKRLYKDVDGAVIDNEVTADLVGDYLFTDADFVSRLSVEKPNVFKKIYDEIKYFVKSVTGSKEARELEKVKKIFENAYKESAKPTTDTKYSMNESEITPERISDKEDDISYSLSYNSEIAKGQSDYIAKGKGHVSEVELDEAHRVTNAMVDVMMKYSNILPEDKIGKVLTKNGSYDRSVENTTICVRTLAYNEFVDKVQEEIGRPLTQMESFLVSQKLYDIATEPQCMYCYVSLDRKAFNDMLLRYMTDRDTVIDKYNKSDKSDKAIAELYEEFLNGIKDTKPMKDRFNKWISDVDNGVQLLSLADIATEERQSVIKANGGELAKQLADARKYAQSASWSKIQKNYVAYRDEILKLGDRVVKNLNEHYGLRWYSFSDYSPAFIVENMQQITDASIRGLKGLSYTKDTDYAEIFASSGMNINVSVFVNQDENGNFFIDEKQSANFERAKELREKYPNVGIVATVTNDEALRWAGSQEWSDVIIPFHIVRTGTDVAQYYKWLNYTAESADTINDKNLWDAYVDSLNIKSENARKKVSKNIYPNEHKNDKTTYLTLCENRGLTPRFARFAGEDWYMKLVNETRLSAEESVPLKPIYDLESAQASFQKFIKKGGYEGGWYKEGVDVDAEAKDVASDVLAGKQANEVDYGRQDNFDPTRILGKRRTNRTHGKFSLSDYAPVRSDVNQYSLSNDSDGKQLSKEQQDYFKDSKVRDENGNLKVMYHGTGEGGFHEFKIADDGQSFFFTDNNETAKSYSGTHENYTAQTLRTADEFNKFFESVNADEYEVREENGQFVLYEDGDEVATSDTAKGIYDEFRDWTGLGTGSANYKVYLDIKNPLTIDAQNNNWDEIPVPEELKWKVGEEDNGDTASTRDYSLYAKENGYDGVIINNVIDNGLYASGIERFTPSTVAIAFDSNQIKSVDNAKPTLDPDIRYSLSEDEYSQIQGEYAPMTEAEANERDAMQNGRLQSLNENDMPQEVDAPYYGETPIDDVRPFDDRDIKDVGKKNVKAYMYENPEVKPFFQDEAQIMLRELRDSVKGERTFNDQLYYDTGGENGWFATKRQTSDEIAYLLDEFKYTYADIEKGLKAIIEDHGAENNAISKRIEFMIDERLREGYTDFTSGMDIPNNPDYIALLEHKQITEYNDEAYNRWVESLAQEHSLGVQQMADDIAPVKPSEQANKTSDKKQATPKQATKDVAPVKDNGKTESPKVKGTTEQQQIANVLAEEPKTESQRNKRKWAIFKANVFDKGAVFEDLSIKKKNRELMGKWNYALYSEARAQRLMGNGNSESNVKSLNAIREEVESTGLTKQFYEYMYHKHNVDRMNLEGRFEDVQNKPVFGFDVTSEMSQEIVDQYEFAEPRFMEFAQDVYDYMKHLRQQLVDNGVISQKTADLWQNMYPHYVPIRRVDDTGLNVNVPLDTGRTGVNAPIKKATGGNSDILPMFDTMAMRTMQTFKATAKNSFGVELKNTLGGNSIKAPTTVDELIDSIDAQDSLLQEGKNGSKPTFTVFENGERVIFEITEDMYDALKPVSDSSLLSKTIKPLNIASNIHRGLLTEYNPVFMLNNAIKDVQDVLINSQHATKTYLKIPEAHKQMLTKGYWYNEYMENGGEQNTYFDNESNTFTTEKKGVSKALDIFPLKAISKANNYIEMIPRLAEYIASREAGRSVEVSMLDSARVTTNFRAGGDLAKFVNRNGGTFLNASIQGAMQQVRNVREANMNGLKGWANLATKFAIAGVPAFLLNNMLWDDDEDYEELSDYVKQSYYVVGKYGDGQFIRIPKGRTVAVIQEGIRQIGNARTGNDEADLKSFLEFVVSNLAPNNPLENNVLAPLKQAWTNETWYGEDLVPSRLQDMPVSEQYDESTDSLSIFLSNKISEITGDNLNISPIKINYLLDQYSGGVGDVVLPMLTPEAESGDDSFVGNLLAPLKKKFTTDSVMNNQNVSDFYALSDELTLNANKTDATEDDMLKNKYINSIKSEIGELYQQKRDIQNAEYYSDSTKYELVRDIQNKIDILAEDALNTYESVNVSGRYATVGDKQFLQNDEYGWRTLNEEQIAKQEKASNLFGISASEYWKDDDDKYVYDWAVKNPEYYQVSRAISDDVFTYWKHNDYMWNNIRADKDENGKSIPGTKKDKIIDYINSIDDLAYEEKLVLFKKYYPADDTYNNEIIDYLNSRDDISYDEMVTILEELDFEVDEEGYISW